MNLAHRPTKILVTGKSGSGKSTFASRFLLNVDARVRFIYDHQGEFSLRFKVAPAVDAEGIARQLASGWVFFDPSRMFPGKSSEGWDFFCDFVFEVSQQTPGRKLLFCDELQMLMSRSTLPDEFASVLETGRRYELDLLLVAQQVNLLNNRVRNQLTEIVSFTQTDRTALDWLEDSGFDPGVLRSLPAGQYVDRRLSLGLEESGRVF